MESWQLLIIITPLWVIAFKLDEICKQLKNK